MSLSPRYESGESTASPVWAHGLHVFKQSQSLSAPPSITGGSRQVSVTWSVVCIARIWFSDVVGGYLIMFYMCLEGFVNGGPKVSLSRSVPLCFPLIVSPCHSCSKTC